MTKATAIWLAVLVGALLIFGVLAGLVIQATMEIGP